MTLKIPTLQLKDLPGFGNLAGHFLPLLQGLADLAGIL